MGDNWQEVLSRKHRNSKAYDVSKISKSVFITNFPDCMSARELWKTCSVYGTVVDVFIPFKKSKAGKRFAFVRFIKVFNLDRLVKNLSTIWIGKLHLIANHVWYERPLKPYVNPTSNSEAAKSTPKHNVSQQTNSRVGSYAKAVNNVYSGLQGATISASPAMVLDDSCLVERELSMYAMGKVKDFSSIPNLYFILNEEGFSNVKLSYLGGTWVLFEFSKTDTKVSLKNHTGVKSWFYVIQEACNDFVSDERIVLVDIEGVPLNAWTLHEEKEYSSEDDSVHEPLNTEFRHYPNDITSDDDCASDIAGVPETEFGSSVSSLARDIGGLNAQVMSTSQAKPVESSNASTGQNVVKNGGSVLEVMEDIIRVGQMNALSINIQGLGHKTKNEWITELNIRHKINFLAIQETKMASVSHMDVKFIWGNSNYQYISSDAIGSSGGILCIWEASVFKKDYATISDNFIGIYGTWASNNVKVLFVTIYAPQHAYLKRVLWEYILVWIGRWNGEVIIMGDFNEVRFADERRGLMFYPSMARCFNNFISSFGLVDIKLEGFSFTWSHPSASKLSKLDRFFVSEGILVVFPSIIALCLDRHLSDHRPILLHEVHTDFGPIPFCFYHSWFSFKGFDDMVEHTWNSFSLTDSNGMIRFKKKLQGLKIIIRNWVKAKKHHLSGVRCSIKNELGDIDKDLDRGDLSDSKLHRRMDLLHQLHDIDISDSKDFIQKSKIKWVVEGDENSKFFHGIINKKRSQLAIRGVFVDGLWVTDPCKVKDAFRNHFEARFQESDPFQLKFQCSFNNRLSPIQVKDLEKSITRDEIHYWPISLIGCIYKVVTKVLSNRLAHIISDLVSDTQSAFVANRQILDGPFILSEVISWCKRKKKQAMFFKVDFAKTYDSAFGFGPNWCKWIRGISLNGKSSISHLFYADDAMFVGVVVPHYLVEQAANSIGCSIIDKCFRYLGVKVKTLSIGGRLTLLKSVLGASPIYNMSIYKVPKGVLKTMESIRNSFFNGADPSNKKITWAAWNKVLAAKKNGGLGVSSFHVLNRALLLKWVWRFVSQDRSLWYRVIQAIHEPSIESHASQVSSNWCSILRELEVLKSKGFNFLSYYFKRIGDGCQTRFWQDRWLAGMVLKDSFPRIFALELDKYVSVASKMREDMAGSFQRNVRDGVERQQFSELVSMLESVSLSLAQDRWCCDLSGDDWSSWFLTIHLSRKLKAMLEGVFYIAWWSIWVFRNRSIFDASPPRRSAKRHKKLRYSFLQLRFMKHLINQRLGIKFHIVLGIVEKDLQEKLSSIDVKVDQGSANDEDLKTHSDLSIHLGDLNRMDAQYLVQKVKIKWAIEGDENTKFFHGSLEVKRRQLAIRGILKDGDWIEDPVLVKDAFLAHFRNRFNHSSRMPPSLEVDMINLSSSQITEGSVDESTSRNISLGTSLTTDTNSSWLSLSGLFAFGFYQQEDGFAVGIWLTTKPNITVVWTANRDDPPLSSNSTIELTVDGWLLLYTTYGKQNLTIYQTDPATSASMLDSALSGRFTLNMQVDGNLLACPRNSSQWSEDSYWSTGTVSYSYKTRYNSLHLENREGSLYMLGNGVTRRALYQPTRSQSRKNEKVVFRATLIPDGNFLYSHIFTTPPSNLTDIRTEWSALHDPCDVKGICGVNSYCETTASNAECHCFPGFLFSDNTTNGKFLGCYRNFTDEEACSQPGPKLLYNITALENMELGVFPYSLMNLSKEACSKSCLDDCSCWVGLYVGGSCQKFKAPIMYAVHNKSILATVFIKISIPDDQVKDAKKPVSASTNQNLTVEVYRKQLVSILGITLAFLALMCTVMAFAIFFFYRAHAHRYESISENIDFGLFSDHFTLRSFSLDELHKATDGFMDPISRNSRGEVYKGFIADGKKAIAVKKLHRMFEGGGFQAEITAISQTHHRNLVRLVGFCIHGATKLLVYEFMSNGSLADLLNSDTHPGWKERVRLALDVARGILYLHEECETRIIHCNINPQNILFDELWTGKISDFGLSKLLRPNQSKTLTDVRGTRGYLAPEWHKNTLISTKVDIYSFGVVLLEILCCSGEMEIDFSSDNKITLSNLVYDCFVNKDLSRLIGDDEVDINMCEKMVKMGLLCIQDDPDARPSIKNVILMLEGTTDIPIPPSPTPLLI
nr:G-type lectin S-receptor-like serine/threonine-protein kinase LECRK1 [Tanacetum cinerariifolium]